jgi:SAM-dependent methyltransferase
LSAVFQKYATFYDIYYREKDYAAESAYVLELFRRHATRPVRSILDLGCGTGSHGLNWASAGLSVTGMDLSEPMLEQARRKATGQGLRTEFIQGDIRTLDLRRTFDAVTSMFAVLGYLTANEDLERAFQTARRHLDPGGLFVFDAWNGPAVLTQAPQNREKTFPGSEPGQTITRLVRPELDAFRHIVRTHITIRRHADGNLLDEFEESHLVRFFFPQEISYYLTKAGFELVSYTPFLATEGMPGVQDWNTTVVARVAGYPP